MNTKEVTAQVFSWLRFKKNILLVGTEVVTGASTADVLACDEGIFTEVEVKISISDLNHDFAKITSRRFGNQINKHEHLANDNSVDTFKPHYFYFAVPQEIADKAVEVVSQKASKNCGVVAVTKESVRVVKRALKLRTTTEDKDDHWVKRCLILRMGSDLANRMRADSGLERRFG